MPVFVKLDDSREIQRLIGTLKNTLTETYKGLDKIKDLSVQEKHFFDEWKNHFNDATDKINQISEHLLEPESV